MTTLTIAPSPDTGSQQLTITPTATVTNVRRSDVNGSYNVRVLDGVLPHPVASGVLVLDDYEAADGTATYTVDTAAGTVTASAALDLGVPWLGVPVAPQFSARAHNVYGYAAGGESRSTVLEPDGSPWPIVITRGGSTRRGTLDIWAGSYAAALELFRLFQRGQVILLRQSENPGMDMFFHASRYSITTLVTRPDAVTVFGVSTEYLEVGRPSAPLSGALGWTWGALLNAHASWGDVFTNYASWGDARINRKALP